MTTILSACDGSGVSGTHTAYINNSYPNLDMASETVNQLSISLANDVIAYGGSTVVTVTLSGTNSVSNLPITISSSNSGVATVTPNTCIISSQEPGNNTCQVTVNAANTTNYSIITASAAGYTAVQEYVSVTQITLFYTAMSENKSYDNYTPADSQSAQCLISSYYTRPVDLYTYTTASGVYNITFVGGCGIASNGVAKIKGIITCSSETIYQNANKFAWCWNTDSSGNSTWVDSYYFEIYNGGQPTMTSPSSSQSNNVPVNSSFVFQFPDNVNSSSVVYGVGGTIQIYDSTGAVVPCNSTWLSSSVLQLTPIGSLAYNTNYIFSEAGVTNTDGNAENSTTIQFHTLWIEVEDLPEDMHLGSVWTDTFMSTPVGTFGLKGYLITNKGSLPLNLINLINANVPFGIPYTDEFWIDSSRSSCYAQSVTLVDSITLNPQAQCSIVVRYQPQFYGENSTLIFTVAALDSESNQQISESIRTPYSSRESTGLP